MINIKNMRMIIEVKIITLRLNQINHIVIIHRIKSNLIIKQKTQKMEVLLYIVIIV